MAILEFVKETVVGTLYVIFIWATRVTTTNSSPSTSSLLSTSSPNRPLVSEEGSPNGGLSIALLEPPSEEERRRRRIAHSSSSRRKAPSLTWLVMNASSSSSWTSSGSGGDLIGTESGVHMVSGDGPAPWDNYPSTSRSKSAEKKKIKKKKQELQIPPPITLLQGREGDNYSGPLPWSLTREYTDDGRLILRESTVQYFEYLQATRSDGRLRIDLVAVDNTQNCCPSEEEMGAEDSDGDESGKNKENEGNNAAEESRRALLIIDDGNHDGMPISFSASLPDMTMENGMRSVETLKKCLTYTEGFTYASHSSSPQLM
ncbi:hypothetical protein M9H77_31931 [Catharanthus roseus]|uniref:Uncharacterized protein n=1 Tax=Catharanthus roseus TaxID=4058 RepID=A0ACC0A1U4_CATRO|nr:hypothetical protein M9H77_31931 [Catharanthus roseus]